ncbi:DUF2157 domain-containing protein [Shewanella olleyana]|uniref:DUF2157 domain-containing protein n=1 Tax=Shewanella olleyana TaxID=135626 RepID=UPI00200FC71B|nr:DUF2157 domain-containing protein [Shewanella olleyana]MCL1068556.1 DUF2157 domain-containing protein [Shewanella olleyana]
MNLSQKQLDDAVEQDILTGQQANELWQFLLSQTHSTEPASISSRFDFTHVLYYFGGFIAIGAMTLFMELGWEAFGGMGIVALSVIYAVIGLWLTELFKNKGYVIPAGICATFVVALTPLAIYGLQQAFGIWPDDTVYRDYHRYIKWHWLYMELGTLVVGAVIAWKYKYPFLMMPIAITLWYLTMDLTAMLNGGDYSWELRRIVSLYTGLLMVILAFWIDIRSRYKADYAFWIYLFGILAFWLALTSMDSDSEWSKLVYFCINIAMIIIGAILVRRVFVVFGAIGSFIYIEYLASSMFKDSWLFPISLTIIGLGIIYLGILWQKHEQRISNKIRRILPTPLRELISSRNVF